MTKPGDTDPAELTPPDGVFFLQTDAPPELMVDAINRLSSIQRRIFDAVKSIHQGMVNLGICPNPVGKCVALDMAETASVGVAELHGLRRRDNRWMVAIGIIAGAMATVAGSYLSRGTSEAAAAVAAKVAVEAARDEVRKSQQTTEQIAFRAGHDGAMLGAREVIAAIPTRPIARKPDAVTR
jgi:hypothetical protein